MDRVTFDATVALDGDTLSGIAHAFGQRTLVGTRYVEFARTAFDHALLTSDVRAFVNHDTTLILGRQGAGTVDVAAMPDGLHYSIDLPETTYAADLKASITRGDINAMSFGVYPGKVRMTRADDGKQVLTHLSVAELFDISPVALPAFGGTTVELHNADVVDDARRSALRARARARRSL